MGKDGASLNDKTMMMMMLIYNILNSANERHDIESENYMDNDISMGRKFRKIRSYYLLSSVASKLFSGLLLSD